MTAVLSRQTKLALVPEATPGVYLAPGGSGVYIPILSGPTPKPDLAQLRDESFRTNDSILQGAYPGPRKATYDFEMSAYPTEMGHLFRGIVGPDTVTAAPTASTTSAPITAGSSAISITVAGTPGGVVIVSDGVNPIEVRFLVTATTVNQPFVYPHNTASTVTYLTKHTFQQGSTLAQPTTYSLTDFDGVQTFGFSYARLASLDLTIDPQAILKAKGSFASFFPQAQSNPSPTYTTLTPMLGWQWAQYPAATLAAAGLASRYTMAELNLAREIDAIGGADGTQDPREMFAAEMGVTGKLSAIYENTGSNRNIDYDTFQNKVQSVPINTFVAGATSATTGGALQLSLNKPDYRTFVLNRQQKYATCDMDIDGIYNATDVGQATVVLWNTQTTAY